MVIITPMANGRGQLSINVGTEKVRLDCSKTEPLKMSDEDYALAKESIAPWIDVKVTVEEGASGAPGEDTGVLNEVDAGAKKAAAKKKGGKAKSKKKPGRIARALGAKG